MGLGKLIFHLEIHLQFAPTQDWGWLVGLPNMATAGDLRPHLVSVFKWLHIGIKIEHEEVMRYLTLLLLPLLACNTGDGFDPLDDGQISSDAEDGEQYSGYDSSDKADGFTPPDGPLEFDGACTEGERLTIAAVGDVLLHGRLQRQAYGADNGFISLWAPVVDLLAAADVSYANLEGPTAAGANSSGYDVTDPGATFDGTVYTSYPMFNYHPSLIDDLLSSGIDIVSTANNHSLDRRSLGVDRTIDALRAAGLPFTGTRKRDEESPQWHTVTRSNGFALAWLACTFSTNGIPDRDDQVLMCYQDIDEVESLVQDLAGREDIDAVILTPHFGDEYDANPNDSQVELAHRMLDAGALAVIGSHPHVLQPWERYITPDDRETFVIYSLGNFVSGQRHLPRRSTLVLYLGLTRSTDGRVVINGARYVPLHMSDRGSRLQLEVVDQMSDLGDSRALTVGMFHGWNLHAPNAPLVTDPQCDPEWEPPPSPHPHDGWIGGSCSEDSTCGGATCLADLTDGLCTEVCESTCPDRAGRAVTFCVDLGLEDGGRCVARCGSDYECRQGYSCQPTERYSDSNVVRGVCLPSA